MNRWIRLSWCVCMLALVGFVALPGCNNKGTEVAKSKSSPPPDHLDYGPHGGPCAEWGKEDYHAEFIVDADKKQVIVYVLDGDAKAAPKNLEASKITEMKVTIKEAEQITLVLKHDPKLSGDKGIAFTAEHPKFAKPAGMKVNIAGHVEGVPYSGDVDYKAPKKDTSALYLNPGGIYTAADIKANGNRTAAEKFKGQDWSGAHDDNVKPGDKVCPVTKSKALSECAWTVKGQNYEFCCPPCVDKFINWAHFYSDRIKNANEYVYKPM
jgi:hypothetical protein